MSLFENTKAGPGAGHRCGRALDGRPGAFTLVELLVVLSLIALLATLTLPALKNIRQTNTMVGAGRQLVDDIAFARARAISDRTTVHVVFVPSEIMTPWNFNNDGSKEGTRDYKLGERLRSGQYTSYAIYAERSVGDQPGRPRFRYLTSWKTLPDGVFIATNKFINNPALMSDPVEYNRPFEYNNTIPFPTIYGFNYGVPHLAFDAQGRLVDNNNTVRFQNEVIPLTRGSILYVRDNAGALVDFDVRESPKGNSVTNFHRVIVDGLTGRARVETPQIQ